MPKLVVVNITALSFSGSTWLNLMLGSHPEAFSVGELKKVSQSKRAICTIHGEECPLWSRYEHPSTENPFVQLARLTGKRFLIVNKSRHFIQYQRDPAITSRFIHLLRDPRAVLASCLRKKPDRRTFSTARLLSHDLRRNLRLHRRQPPEEVTTAFYEHVQRDTEAELRRLCEFIGMEYDAAMLAFWEPEHHFIAGNRGTLFGMLRKGDQVDTPEQVLDAPRTSPQKWELGHYRRTDAADFKDERWKRELSDGQLRLYRLAAGWIHRRLGYPAVLDRGASLPSAAGT